MKYKYGFGEIVRIIRVNKAQMAAEMMRPCEEASAVNEFCLDKLVTDNHAFFFVSNKMIRQSEITIGTRIIINFTTDTAAIWNDEFGWEERTTRDLKNFGLHVNYNNRTIEIK